MRGWESSLGSGDHGSVICARGGKMVFSPKDDHRIQGGREDLVGGFFRFVCGQEVVVAREQSRVRIYCLRAKTRYKISELGKKCSPKDCSFPRPTCIIPSQQELYASIPSLSYFSRPGRFFKFASPGINLQQLQPTMSWLISSIENEVSDGLAGAAEGAAAVGLVSSSKPEEPPPPVSTTTPGKPKPHKKFKAHHTKKAPPVEKPVETPVEEEEEVELSLVLVEEEPPPSEEVVEEVDLSLVLVEEEEPAPSVVDHDPAPPPPPVVEGGLPEPRAPPPLPATARVERDAHVLEKQVPEMPRPKQPIVVVEERFRDVGGLLPEAADADGIASEDSSPRQDSEPPLYSRPELTQLIRGLGRKHVESWIQARIQAQNERRRNIKTASDKKTSSRLLEDPERLYSWAEAYEAIGNLPRQDVEQWVAAQKAEREATGAAGAAVRVAARKWDAAIHGLSRMVGSGAADRVADVDRLADVPTVWADFAATYWFEEMESEWQNVLDSGKNWRELFVEKYWRQEMEVKIMFGADGSGRSWFCCVRMN